MYSKIQSVRYTKTKTIHLRRSFFWKKKLGMALKQEIIVWIKTEFGLSTPLFEGSEKNPNRVIACFEAIQNHIKNQKNLLHIQ